MLILQSVKHPQLAIFGQFLRRCLSLKCLSRVRETAALDTDMESQCSTRGSLGLPKTSDADMESPQLRGVLDVNVGGQHFGGDSYALPNSPGVEAGRQYIRKGSRILLYGKFDPEQYILVRLSKLEGYESGLILRTLDSLGQLDEILSTEELTDKSWELPVLKSYLPRLQDQLRKHFPRCHIEPDNDPTEPEDQQEGLPGYHLAKILKTRVFCERAKHMKQDAFPRAAAFYSHLTDKVESGQRLN